MLLLGRRAFSVEGATLEPPRDEVMEGLSLYYMHGFEKYALSMHKPCVTRQLERPASREEGGDYDPGGCGGTYDTWSAGE